MVRFWVFLDMAEKRLVEQVEEQGLFRTILFHIHQIVVLSAYPWWGFRYLFWVIGNFKKFRFETDTFIYDDDDDDDSFSPRLLELKNIFKLITKKEKCSKR